MSTQPTIVPEAVPYASLQLSISLLGIFGNIVVVWVILILREYQKSITHWYVLQLAIADLLFLVTVPFSTVETLLNSWPFPEWMCKIKEAILFLNYYSSVFLLMVMSIDRYIAVCHSFSKPLQKLRKRISALIITANIWLISAFLCVPIIMAVFKSGVMPECKCQYDFKVFLPQYNECSRKGNCNTFSKSKCHNLTLTAEESNYEVPPNFSGESGFFDNYDSNFSYTNIYNEGIIPGVLAINCHYISDPIGFSVFLGFNFAAMFLMPLFIMVVCYGLIVIRLSANQVTRVGESFRKRNTSTSHSNTVRKRVTVMCATLVCCFVICWLPYHTIHLAKIKGIDGTESSVCTKLSQLGSLLAYLNSALNPCLYGFLGTNFKKRLQTAGKSFRIKYRGNRSTSSVFLPARSSQKVRRERHSSTSTNATRPELARLRKNSGTGNSSTQDAPVQDLQFRRHNSSNNRHNSSGNRHNSTKN